MKPVMWVGVILIVLGAVALGYRTFSYSSEETVLQVGPLEATVEKQEHVTVPLWAGIGLIVVGAVVLIVGARRR
ncbi:MAG: hypothetical protein AB7E55_08480 [Pigmentiphaga sp.]